VPIDSFQHSYVIAAAADQVYRHLIEPTSQIGLSPLIVDVRDVRHGKDDAGRETVAYVAVERFQPNRLLHWDNHIRVTTTQTSPGHELRSEVISPGRVRLASILRLTACAAGTQAVERIVVESPRLLRGFVVSEARRVQLARATALAHRMA
jgi:hypothetical protein